MKPLARILLALCSMFCEGSLPCSNEGAASQGSTTLEVRDVVDSSYSAAQRVTDLRGNTVYVGDSVFFDLSDLAGAKTSFDPDVNLYVLQLRWKEERAVRWTQFTEKRVGLRIGILIDGKIFGMPKLLARSIHPNIVIPLYGMGRDEAQEIGERLLPLQKRLPQSR